MYVQCNSVSSCPCVYHVFFWLSHFLTRSHTRSCSLTLSLSVYVYVLMSAQCLSLSLSVSLSLDVTCVAALLQKVLREGGGVVFANKKVLTGPKHEFDAFTAADAEQRSVSVIHIYLCLICVSTSCISTPLSHSLCLSSSFSFSLSLFLSSHLL